MSQFFGVDNDGMVFEGPSEHAAHLIWPQPVVTLAKFVKSDVDEIFPAKSGELNHCYFREDSFDPVSRIRRGRFYQWTGRSGHNQVYVPEGTVVSGMFPTSNSVRVMLNAYQRYNPSISIEDSQDNVILGSSSGYSVWAIVSIETISSGEVLVTLRARQSLGALPDIYWAKIPAEFRNKVEKAIKALADDYRRAGSESVIDRAREAATAILSAYLQNKGVDEAKGKDLGVLINKLTDHAGQHEQQIVACAADIARRLHSRGKHAEKEKHDELRPIRGQDAELAVQCVGVMLCDLRWADWK